MKTNILTIIASVFLFLPGLLQAQATIRVSDESVAGLPVLFSLSELTPGESFELSVRPPFGTVKKLIFQSDETGKKELRLEGSETETAGAYQAAVIKNELPFSETVTFTVHPDSVSTRQSALESDRSYIEPNARDEALITVILRDQFDNTLKGRPVTLISSRSEDTITPINSETDETGVQQFTFSTSEAGTVSLRAMDLLSGELLDRDISIEAGLPAQNKQPEANTATQNASNTINQLPSAAMAYGMPMYNYPPFYANPYFYNPYAASLMQYPLTADLQQSFDVIDHFDINAPLELKVNDDATIALIAKDKNNKVVEDYTGTVKLTSTDPAAYLPLSGNVKFKESDLGKKTLTLGLRFRTVPSDPVNPYHILRAEDASNTNIKGEVSIKVIGNQPSDDTKQDIKVVSPAPGGTISNRQITIEGTGPAFINIDLYDLSENEENIIASGETDINETFHIDVQLDQDGNAFNLQLRDREGKHESKQFTYTLDEDVPTIDNISFDPPAPEEQDMVTITVLTEADLASANYKITGTEIDLPLVQSTGTGVYIGTFRAPPAGEYEVTVSIKNNNGLMADKSETLLISGKEAPPADPVNPPPAVFNIDSVLFIPATPEAGQKVQVSTQTLTGLADVSLVIANSDIQLQMKEITGAPGTYQGEFIAPAQGQYAATITANNSDGGSAQKTQVLTVLAATAPPSLPVITNLQASGEINAVKLTWEPFTAGAPAVDSIQIYIGRELDSFDYVLSAAPKMPEALIEGLTPSERYYFQLTAKQGDRESEPSQTVSAVTQGMVLEVTPQDSALLLNWSKLETDIPLSSFVLEYGTNPNSFSERRLLNGELRLMTLNDLINGLTYYLRLTPMDTTSTFRDELKAEAQGTPNGDGFTISANEDIPDGMQNQYIVVDPVYYPQSDLPYSYQPLPPQTIDTGFKVTAGGIAAAIAAITGFMLFRLKRHKHAQELFLSTAGKV